MGGFWLEELSVVAACSVHYKVTHELCHTLTLMHPTQSSPQSWQPLTFSLAFCSAISHIQVWLRLLTLLVVFGLFLFPLILPPSSPFHGLHPTGLNLPPTCGPVLFEGCCDDRPRLSHNSTTSSSWLHSGPMLQSTLGAFYNPTDTPTHSHTHTVAHGYQHICQLPGGSEWGPSLAETHTDRHIHTHTHTGEEAADCIQGDR